MRNFVNPSLLTDPTGYWKAAHGVDLLAFTVTQQAALGRATGSNPPPLVNPAVRVVTTTDDGVASHYVRLVTRNGSLEAQRAQSPAERAKQQRLTNSLRDNLFIWLFGTFDDGIRTGDGVVHTMLDSGMTYNAVAESLFGALETIGVIQASEGAEETAAVELLGKMAAIHFENGDVETGDIRTSGGASGESRAYQGTVLLNGLINAQGQWGIGDGKSQASPGQFGPDRLFRCLIGQWTATNGDGEPVTRATSAGEVPDVLFVLNPQDNAPSHPAFRDDCPDAENIWASVQELKAVMPNSLSRQEIDPAVAAATVDWAILQGVLTDIQEQFEKSGAPDYSAWVENRRGEPVEDSQPS